MARTVMDLDPALLAEVKAIYGVKTNVDAVRKALEEAKRQAALKRFVEFVKSGEMYPDEIGDFEEFRRRAWSGS